jgi:hypothetical protein
MRHNKGTLKYIGENMTEREMLIQFKEAVQRLDDIKAAQKDAQAVKDKLEAEIVDYLTGKEAVSTAKYDGIGYAQMAKPRVFASCLAENKDTLKEHMRKIGREDLIREDIPAPSLSSYVGELIEAGKPIPDIISYYLKTSVKIY